MSDMPYWTDDGSATDPDTTTMDDGATDAFSDSTSMGDTSDGDAVGLSAPDAVPYIPEVDPNGGQSVDDYGFTLNSPVPLFTDDSDMNTENPWQDLDVPPEASPPDAFTPQDDSQQSPDPNTEMYPPLDTPYGPYPPDVSPDTVVPTYSNMDTIADVPSDSSTPDDFSSSDTSDSSADSTVLASVPSSDTTDTSTNDTSSTDSASA